MNTDGREGMIVALLRNHAGIHL